VAYLNNLKILNWLNGTGLLQSQQTLNEVNVRFVYNTIFVERTFTAIRLFGKNVTLEGFLMRNFAGAGYFESFFGTGVCFHLWHNYIPFLVIPCWRSRTDGKLFGPCGQWLFYWL
jgi:hypothetical protein